MLIIKEIGDLDMKVLRKLLVFNIDFSFLKNKKKLISINNKLFLF